MASVKAVTNISLLAAGLLLLQGTAFASFPDVPTSHPNYDAILYLQTNVTRAGDPIIAGYPDGTYKPNITINRAEFVKILVNSQFEGYDPDKCAVQSFPDVRTSDWFNKYVCIAKQWGVVNGYPDGTFKPNNAINFSEAAKIIVRTFNGLFKPSETDRTWYESYVKELEKRNLIPLSITSFDKQITRGEMAEIIYRWRADVTTKPSQTYESLSSDDATQTYNGAEGWSLTYPSSWTVGSSPYEDAIQFSVPYSDGRKYVSQAWIDVLMAATCPTVEPGPGTVVQTITLGGLAFVATELADDAASGTVHHEIDFTSRLSPSKCLVLKKNIVVQGELRLTTQEKPLAAQELSAMQDTLKNVLKTLTISSPSSSLQWHSYQNKNDGYSMRYPANWDVQENASLPSVDVSISVDRPGTLFKAQKADAHVFVAITSTCPDLSHNFEPTPNPSLGSSVTINGRTFASAYASDGAAGSVGEYMYYASKRDATHCIVIVTYYFHTTGDANDEPVRSQVKLGIAEMKDTLNQIVQSFKDM